MAHAGRRAWYVPSVTSATGPGPVRSQVGSTQLSQTIIGTSVKQPAISPLSVVPNVRTTNALEHLQRVSLAIVLLLGGVTLAGWLIHPLAHLLPASFRFMRANTALLTFLSGLGVSFGSSRRSATLVNAGKSLGVLVACFATLILLKDFSWIQFRIETLLAADTGSMYPGKVSPEAACAFLLIGIVVAGMRARKSVLSHFMDATLLLLSFSMLVFVARYFFGLGHLFLLFQNNPFSVQTLVCLSLLTFLVGTRRAEYGLFGILLDSGNGGIIARLAVPSAAVLPFLIAVPKALLAKMHPERENSLTATATSLISISAVCMVLVLAWRTKAFETAVRDLSLRDELTGLYNRRGFYLLAEQTFYLARRSDESFSVLFFDMDGLKQVNDTLGHEAGSELIKEMSTLLVEALRRTDVIGRIGGDEFVVAGRFTPSEIEQVVARLAAGVESANAAKSGRCLLSFSLGYAIAEQAGTSSLEELLTKADAMMYENKRSKKTSRGRQAEYTLSTSPS